MTYYCALLKSADLCLEIMDFMKPPNEIDHEHSIRAFIMNVLLSNRTFKNTKIVLNKCDDSEENQKQQAMVGLWKAKLLEYAKDYLPLNFNEDVFCMSGLFLFKYRQLHFYERIVREDEQFLNQFSGEWIKDTVKAAKKKDWEQRGKGAKILTFLTTCIEKHQYQIGSHLGDLKTKLHGMLEDCTNALAIPTQARILSDKTTIEECARATLTKPLAQLKETLQNLQAAPICDMTQVIAHGRGLWERAKELVDACDVFRTKASANLACKKYLTYKWEHLKQQAYCLYKLFYDLNTSTSNEGFFKALFTTKTAMILVNLTYIARVSGYLASTWWCVPIFAGLVVVDTIITGILWWRSSREATPQPVDRTYLLWKEKIGEIAKQYENFQEQFTEGINDLIYLQGLSPEAKAAVQEEIGRLRQELH